MVEFGAFYISLNYLKNPPENVDLAKGDATVMAVISGGALLITYLWSCIDAVIVANKINIDNGYVLKAEPTFNYNNLASMDKPGFTTGLSFSLSF
ncbi:MAG: hypothetical protein K6F85_06515 [Bacteroidales bacterium]|nr:hypothetical protein [Bacteroidales bacterium]